LLKAYFDESGFEGPLFTLCGYVAPRDVWETFDGQWQALLQKPCIYPVESIYADSICKPLEYLHAQEMEGLGSGRFRQLGQHNRYYLINASISLITRSPIIGVGSGVLMEAYKKLPERARQYFGSPYMMCLRSVLSEVARHSRAFIGEDEYIAYIFEDQPKWALKARELWEQLKAVYAAEYRMGTLAFAPKKKFTPLQAADRLAYETFKHFSEPHKTRPAWNRFLTWGQHHGKYFDEAGAKIALEDLKLDGIV
jgi:hypothetical protein